MLSDENQFYFELYKLQIEKRSKIYENFNIQILVISLFWGIFIFYFQYIFKFTKDFTFFILIFLLFCAFVVLIVNTIYIFYAFRSYNYKYLPLSIDINKYLISLQKYYSKNNSKNNKTEYTLENYINDRNLFIKNSLIDCNDTNTINNDRKAIFLHKSATCFIFSIIILILSSIPFYIKFYSYDEYSRIEVINPKDFK